MYRTLDWKLKKIIYGDEIDLKSEQIGVHTSNFQRDAVFGWILMDLYQDNNSTGVKIFLKGGSTLWKA